MIHLCSFLVHIRPLAQVILCVATEPTETFEKISFSLCSLWQNDFRKRSLKKFKASAYPLHAQ
jgi:hypothetical protein